MLGMLSALAQLSGTGPSPGLVKSLGTHCGSSSGSTPGARSASPPAQRACRELVVSGWPGAAQGSSVPPSSS